MKCPGCSGELEAVTVDVLDNSFRCKKCRGFWIQNWVVNNIAAGNELQVTRAGVEPIVDLGTNRCPKDGTLLMSLPKDMVPEGMIVEKCITCASWWFPGDGLFDFQKAMRTKSEYVKVWNRKDWTHYAWPALVVALLLVGVAGGVNLVQNQQQSAIRASIGVRQFVPIVMGGGRVEIRFKTDQIVELVEYKKVTDTKWKSMEVNQEDGWYVVRFEGLEVGQYAMKILDKEYIFVP